MAKKGISGSAEALTIVEGISRKGAKAQRKRTVRLGKEKARNGAELLERFKKGLSQRRKGAKKRWMNRFLTKAERRKKRTLSVGKRIARKGGKAQRKGFVDFLGGS